MPQSSCHVWVAIGVLLSSTATALPVRAQGTAPNPAPAATSAAAPDAKKLFDDGVKAERNFLYQKARDLFAQSFALQQTPETAARLGRLELKTSKYLEAAEHLTFYLQNAQGLTDAERKTTEKQIAEAKAKLGAVTVRVEIEGAEVLVDGQSIGKSPLTEPLVLEPGSWQFEARKDGFTPAKQSLSIKPGDTVELSLKLVPLAPADAAAEAPTTVPAGESKPPVETPPPPDPGPPPPKWRLWAMIGGAGLTAVGLGLGVGLTVAANAKSKDADAQLPVIRKTTPTTYSPCGPKGFPLNQAACTELRDTLSAQDRLSNAAVAMYVIGGVAAVGTAALYLYPRFLRKRKKTGVWIMPAIASDQRGVVISGSF